VYWVQNFGPGFGYPNVGSLPFPASYYYLYAFYHGKFDCAGGPGALTPAKITFVRYSTQKLIFTCYARGIQGGAHNKTGLNVLFVDGHAALHRHDEFLPTIPYTGNYDWTQCGVRGKDIP
jgi:prepilin-type processing-associated H-X9-DG protein